uniref:tetratricopeptide repeat protein n=1 Tax=Amphritea sp. TaxID=1872502 RepID=UPI0035631B30
WQVRQPIYKTSKAKWMRYQNHMADLIKGTNAKIEWDAITDMISLPEPGMLQAGVALYEEGKLDEAEYEFKKLLHHLPEHAAANHMLGVIYARKGHIAEAVELMEKAVLACPWKKYWRKDLIQACEIVGDEEKAEQVRAAGANRGGNRPANNQDAEVELQVLEDDEAELESYLTEYSR